MAHIIKSTGETIEVEPKNGTDFQLKELNAIVGGYIEIAYLSEDRLMILNEEGKLENLPLNIKAIEIYRESVGLDDVIVGDVLVCGINQIK